MFNISFCLLISDLNSGAEYGNRYGYDQISKNT